MSDTMTEGVIVDWHKKVGDKVKSGDVLAEIETDKAVMEFESYQDGTLLYIGANKGQTVKVDDVIAIMGKEGEDYKALLANGTPTTQGDKKEKSTVKEQSSQDKPATQKAEEPAKDVAVADEKKVLKKRRPQRKKGTSRRLKRRSLPHPQKRRKLPTKLKHRKEVRMIPGAESRLLPWPKK